MHSKCSLYVLLYSLFFFFTRHAWGLYSCYLHVYFRGPQSTISVPLHEGNVIPKSLNDCKGWGGWMGWTILPKTKECDGIHNEPWCHIQDTFLHHFGVVTYGSQWKSVLFLECSGIWWEHCSSIASTTERCILLFPKWCKAGENLVFLEQATELREGYLYARKEVRHEGSSEHLFWRVSHS